MRTMNKKLLNEWITIQGELALEDLASKSRIKFHTVRRIVGGEKMPSELEQTAICKATGFERDDLFPIVQIGKQAS